MGAVDPEIEAIERAAFSAWPAAEVVRVERWWLRHTGGVTRRANSAWIAAGEDDVEGERGLAERIVRVESFYRERGASPQFQLAAADGAGSVGRRLDAGLAARGYAVVAPVAVLTGAPRAIADAGARMSLRWNGVEAAVDRTLSEDWFDLSARKGRFAAVTDIYRALLDRIGVRAHYALARDAATGEPIGVGLGVSSEEHFGICSMLTLPEHRRRGAAAAILAALAKAAADAGKATLYLQVERDNAPAATLYARFGLRERYGYHYRVTT